MRNVVTYVVFLVSLESVVPLSLSGDALSRIVGGQEASLGEFPFIVSLQDISLGTNRHFCGGTIYADNYILTAAHCMIDITAADIKVVAGEHDRSINEGNEQEEGVSQIIIHPQFNVDTYLNDIAILRLNQKLHFNDFVKSLPLADGVTVSTSCVAAGWGATVENGNPVNILRKVTLPLWDDASCNTFVQEFCPGCAGLSVCAGLVEGGKDACHGDDGGPLVCSGTEVIGLSSWGYGCARPDKPGVYLEVRHYKQWIESQTN